MGVDVSQCERGAFVFDPDIISRLLPAENEQAGKWYMDGKIVGILGFGKRGGSIMILYHASKEKVEFPEIRKTRYTKDFSWGFYCTNNLEQAIRWANRGDGNPVINYYTYTPTAGLSILKFTQMTDEWLDFIAKCRNGQTHSYDIVEGPMANDTIWNYVNDFLAGRISRRQFWVLAEFRYPTHQISFHTLSALNCLVFDRSEIIYD